MWRVLHAVALWMLVVVAGSPAVGQEAPAIAVGVVDIQRLQRESAAARSLQQQIEAKHAAYLAEVRRYEDELRTADQELTRQRNTLSQEEWEQRRVEFERRVSDVESLVQERKRSIEAAYEQAMAQLNNTMLAIVARISQERRLALVLPKNQVVLAERNLDLTDEVMARLNEELPRIVFAEE